MARKARISAAVLTVLGEGERHAWTLDELHDAVVRRGLPCDFSSLYRAVEKLVTDGAAQRIVLDDGRPRLELASSHHDHLYCVRCNQVVPIPCVIGHGDIAAIEREAGVAIADHHLVLTGICRSCALLEVGASQK